MGIVADQNNIYPQKVNSFQTLLVEAFSSILRIPLIFWTRDRYLEIRPGTIRDFKVLIRLSAGALHIPEKESLMTRFSRKFLTGFYLSLALITASIVFVVAGDDNPDDMVPVEVLAVVGDSLYGTPAVILLDRGSDNVLPIWIGEPEAFAISMELANIEPLRPMTHDLLKSMLERLQVSYLKMEVHSIIKGTYHATIFLEPKTNMKTLKIDARPSDAIALALRFKAPIFVKRSILEENGFSLDAHKSTKPHVKKS